jgi:hypothetical protein
MSKLKFLFPLDGDFVNSRDGVWQEGALYIDVLLESDDGCPTVCNISAVYDAALGCYKARIPLYGYRNRILAKTQNQETVIAVFVTAEEKLKKYRLSSDDNIRFLKELNEGDYASIFDHPYLAVYKKAHDLYGAKAHLNLFYAFDDQARSLFASNPCYFDLSMMTDRYKDEFVANSNWLKLTFHAKSEFPNKPYRYADRKTVQDDCIAVCREICRFAGPECISNSTTIHWGEGNREVIRALRAMGYTSLTGYFTRDEAGDPQVSYYIEPEMVDHIGGRDFWMDTDEDMIFGRIDSVLNIGSLNDVLQEVREAAEDPHRGGFVSIMIHEQYFYPDYIHSLADFEARVLQSCEILTSQGYTGAHISDITRPRPLSDYPLFQG